MCYFCNWRKVGRRERGKKGGREGRKEGKKKEERNEGEMRIKERRCEEEKEKGVYVFPTLL